MKIGKLRGFEENNQNVPLIDNIKNWITYSYLKWFAKENQQSPVYVVNCHFSGSPDRC